MLRRIRKISLLEIRFPPKNLRVPDYTLMKEGRRIDETAKNIKLLLFCEIWILIVPCVPPPKKRNAENFGNQQLHFFCGVTTPYKILMENGVS
jgi:hypothetical protein